MYVKTLQIKNLRCFEDVKLELQYPDRPQTKGRELEMPNINLLLGNNGAGKTSILKALALATVSPVIARTSGLVLRHEVRRITPHDISVKAAEIEADIILHAQDIEDRAGRVQPNSIVNTLTAIRRFGDIEELDSISGGENVYLWHGMFVDKSPAFLVLGYGTMRRADESPTYNFNEQTKSRRLRYQRVASMFESGTTLVPLSLWLPQMKKENSGRHKQVVNLLDRLLPESASFEGLYENSEYYFELNGILTPFGALSDGYRGYVSWIGDLLYHVCMGCPSGVKLVENRGFVLIDEVDLLLHPEWQRTVINTISQALPNLQFVFSTHSPIVAGSVQHENIFVMETDGSGAARVEQYDEKIYGLNAEQVLLSSYFGLRTTRAASYVETKLRPLAQKASKGKPEDALAFMSELSGQSPTKPTATAKSATPKSSLLKVDDEKFQELLRVYSEDKARAKNPSAAKHTKNLKTKPAKKSLTKKRKATKK